MHVSLAELALLAGIFLVAFSIKGIFGFGAVPAIIVLASMVISPHDAVILAAIANLFTHIQFMPEGWRHGDRKLAVWLAVFFLPTVLLGVWFFNILDASMLSIIAGAAIVIMLALEEWGVVARFEPAIQRNRYISGPITAAVSGFISGVIGAGSMVFLAAFVRLTCTERQSFRATIILIAGILVFWRSCMLIATGAVSNQLLIEAAILAPVGIAAGYVGSHVSKKLSNERFFALYRLLLFVGGVSMVWRGLS